MSPTYLFGTSFGSEKKGAEYTTSERSRGPMDDFTSLYDGADVIGLKR